MCHRTLNENDYNKCFEKTNRFDPIVLVLFFVLLVKKITAKWFFVFSIESRAGDKWHLWRYRNCCCENVPFGWNHFRPTTCPTNFLRYNIQACFPCRSQQRAHNDFHLFYCMQNRNKFRTNKIETILMMHRNAPSPGQRLQLPFAAAILDRAVYNLLILWWNSFESHPPGTWNCRCPDRDSFDQWRCHSYLAPISVIQSQCRRDSRQYCSHNRSSSALKIWLVCLNCVYIQLLANRWLRRRTKRYTNLKNAESLNFYSLSPHSILDNHDSHKPWRCTSVTEPFRRQSTSGGRPILLNLSAKFTKVSLKHINIYSQIFMISFPFW